jgi:tyrosinase
MKANPINEINERQSIIELQKPENKDKLDKLMIAWKKMKELDPSDPKSYFVVAGYHGMPFQTEDKDQLGRLLSSW